VAGVDSEAEEVQEEVQEEEAVTVPEQSTPA
jgi:hypothetical protein